MPNFIIEARDINYQRIGLVENYMSFEAIIRHNAVGTWSITVPGNTPEVGYLRNGNGVVVRIDGQDEVAFSGPVTKVSRNWSADDPGPGSVTISGVTDDQLLFERVCYPIPANDLNNQTDERMILLSEVGILMRVLVRDNCGPTARPERIYPQLDVDNGDELNADAIVSTRFDVLGEKLQELANAHGVGWRVRQGVDNERLRFEQFIPQDRTDLVFGREYGNLQSYSYEIEAPTATRLIFACQGEGRERYFTDARYDPWVSETLDDRDSRIEYGGAIPGVTQVSDHRAYMGTYTRMWLPGHSAFFPFTGTGIRLYGASDSANDITVQYQFDLEPVAHSPEIPTGSGPRVLLAEVRGRPYGEHRFDWDFEDGAFLVDYIEVLDERTSIDWTKNAERFYDRRDIPVGWNAAHDALIDPSEGTPADPNVYGPLLTQATLEAWDEVGPKASLSMEPIDTDMVQYGRDYRVGDIVTVDIEGTLFREVLREVRLSDGDDGPRITPTIGDPQASSTPTLYKRLRQLWSKVARMEAQ